MSGVRPPTVAGVGGGVGTTTLAVALRGHDAGCAPGGADIVACRGRPDSLHRAAAVLDRAGPGPRPVLAVTLDGSRAPRGRVRVLLDQLATVASAVVLLPDVRRWRSIGDPLPEVATLLVEPVDQVPRPLRAYAAALRELATAVAASGRLDEAARDHDRFAVERPPDPRRRTGPARGTPARVPAKGAAGRTPPIIGAFRPVVGTVTAADPGPPGAPRSPTRRTGIRIVGPPAPRPAALRPAAARTGHAEARPAGEPPAVRIAQVG